MNLQEQNRMRDKMRHLQIEVERLAALVAELEAKIAALAPLKIVRKDTSRRAIL